MRKLRFYEVFKDSDIKVAYYGGNIKDPLHTLHDEKGLPILTNDEKILIKKEGIKARIIVRWGMLRYRLIDEWGGKGDLYITNKRILYIREPKPYLHGTGFFSIVYILLAREWKKLGRKESFSIPLENIVRYGKRGKHTDVYLWSKEMNETDWKECVLTLLNYSNPEEILPPQSRSINCVYCKVIYPIVATRNGVIVKCPSCGKKSMLR